MKKHKISVIGEGSAIGAILTFLVWASQGTPASLFPLWAGLGVLSVIDYMKGGLTDKSILK